MQTLKQTRAPEFPFAIPSLDRNPDERAANSNTAESEARWEPCKTVAVSLGVSAFLWAGIGALLWFAR